MRTNYDRQLKKLNDEMVEIIATMNTPDRCLVRK